MKGRNRSSRHRVGRSLCALSVLVQSGPVRSPFVPLFRIEGAPRSPVTAEVFGDRKPVPRPVEHYPGVICPPPSSRSDMDPGARDSTPVSNRRTWIPRFRIAATVTDLSPEELRVLTSVWG